MRGAHQAILDQVRGKVDDVSGINKKSFRIGLGILDDFPDLAGTIIFSIWPLFDPFISVLPSGEPLASMNGAEQSTSSACSATPFYGSRSGTPLSLLLDRCPLA